MKTINNFTKGKILSPLLRFSLPILLALLLQAMYGAVDMIIVGKFAQTADISAVATGSMLIQSLTCVITGLAMGVTVILGQQIGASHREQAGKTIGCGIAMFAVFTLAVTAILVIFTSPICHLLQAPADAFDPTSAYIRICSVGMVFIVAFNLLSSIFRGLGDSKMPLIMVVVCRNSNFYYCFDAKSSIWLQIFKENLTKPIAMIVVQN